MRPVPGSFVPKFEPGTPQAAAWQDFLDYGVPVESLPVERLKFDLPGGLGVDSADGVVTIGPAIREGSQGLDLSLRVLAPAGREIARTEVRMEPTTTGVRGERSQTVGRAVSGVFRCVLRFDWTSERLTVTVDDVSVVGAEPAEALRDWEFLSAMRPPNALVLALRHGPQLGPANPVPEALIAESDDAVRVLELLQALATIQEHTVQRIRVPDFTTVRTRDAHAWLEAARLLRGETVEERWTSVRIDLDEGAALPAEADGFFTVATRVPLAVTIDDRLPAPSASLVAQNDIPKRPCHHRPSR